MKRAAVHINLHGVRWPVGLHRAGQVGFDLVARCRVALIELHTNARRPVALSTLGRNPNDLAGDWDFSGSSIRLSSMNTSSPSL